MPITDFISIVKNVKQVNVLYTCIITLYSRCNFQRDEVVIGPYMLQPYHEADVVGN